MNPRILASLAAALALLSTGVRADSVFIFGYQGGDGHRNGRHGHHVTESVHGRSMSRDDLHKWRNGRWSHLTVNGRTGWWWESGGRLFLYQSRISPYPDPLFPLAVEIPAPVWSAPSPYQAPYPQYQVPFAGTWSEPTPFLFPNSKFDTAPRGRWETVCVKRGYAPVYEDCRQVWRSR